MMRMKLCVICKVWITRKRKRSDKLHCEEFWLSTRTGIVRCSFSNCLTKEL